MGHWSDAELEVLRELTEAVERAEHIRRVTVEDLRRDGCPWSVIGEALGITRQAAQQRYGPALDHTQPG